MIGRLKDLVRLWLALWGYLYDFVGFVKSNIHRKTKLENDRRDYYIAMLYHSLEKGLAFKDFQAGRGLSVAEELAALYAHQETSHDPGFHERVGLSVLAEYCSKHEQALSPQAMQILSSSTHALKPTERSGGAMRVTVEEATIGKLSNPEQFFLSRHSIREFAEKAVPHEVFLRAISLAIKAPTACDRQPWKVFYTNDRETIDSCLSLQVGNRGFGHTIPLLAVVCVDLSAFFGGHERNQCWIEGGIFSVSLVWALHSLGLGSCCLNWCATPATDWKLHKVFEIDTKYKVVMMIGIGWPQGVNGCCVALRKPADEFMQELRVGKK